MYIVHSKELCILYTVKKIQRYGDTYMNGWLPRRYRNTFYEDIQRYRDTGIQGLRDTGIQRYRDTGIQGYRVTGIQGYRDTGIQGYMDTGIQRYK